MINNLQIKDVPIQEIIKDIKNPSVNQYMVMSYNVNPSTGELVEDSLLPSVFDKYNPSKNASRRMSKTKEPYQKLGHNNQYPFFLLDLLTKSPTHKKAWKVTANVAYGEGWVSMNAEGDKFLSWLRSKGLNYTFTKAALENIAAFGGVYVNMGFLPQLSESKGSKKVLDSISIGKYTDHRIGKEEESGPNVGEVEYYWYHPAYNANRPNRNYLKGIPRYKSILDVQATSRTLLKYDKKKPYFKNNTLANKNKFSYLIGEPSITSKYYPSAAYESDAAIDSILLEASLSAFDVAGLKNGLMAGYIVTVPLADTSKRDPEGYKKSQLSAKKLIEDKLQGAENNQRTIIVFQDPKDKAEGIKIAAIPHTNTSGMHKMMDERKRQIIQTAWGIPDSRLTGGPLSTGTGFSNQSEVLRTSEQIWYLLGIYPENVVPIEDFIHNILKPIYEFELGEETNALISLKRKTIFNNEPSDEILFSDFTRSERRKRYGSEPLSEDQESILEDELKDLQRTPTSGVNKEMKIVKNFEDRLAVHINTLKNQLIEHLDSKIN